MSEFRVVEVERRVRPGMVPSLFLAPGVQDGTPDIEGWYARVEVTGSGTLDLSKLDGEDGWTVDAVWASNGMPIHANGFGARYLRTRKVTDDVAAAIEEKIK